MSKLNVNFYDFTMFYHIQKLILGFIINQKFGSFNENVEKHKSTCMPIFIIY